MRLTIQDLINGLSEMYGEFYYQGKPYNIDFVLSEIDTNGLSVGDWWIAVNKEEGLVCVAKHVM